MARYRTRGYSRARRPRRQLDWADLTVSGTVIDDGAPVRWRNVFEDWEAVAGGDVEGTTITRIRGNFSWVPATTVQQEYHWMTMGFMVQNMSDMEDLTNTQRMVRLNDPYRDWMLYQKYPTYTSGAENPVFSEVKGWPTYDWDIDVKSKRRFNDLSDTLIFYFGIPGSTDIGSGNSYAVYAHFRVLFQKP